MLYSFSNSLGTDGFISGSSVVSPSLACIYTVSRCMYVTLEKTTQLKLESSTRAKLQELYHSLVHKDINLTFPQYEIQRSMIGHES